ncbi:Bacillus/Clostridium Ger spore germination protein [Acididesulfobacillus acetoxydans]|uniref:Bacillus/Clostridium Ger spore germination protein n=1 Tax=Acididesulfobacillus acetoxydans TaxID=1561005 RepID=A0A8S0WRJ0_9FIRM|nr:spore germination protein [Acididesulfobacillus acetoxydans]CAA7603334.1 Bacillus/Clostridium Ger spore germination protein [Acididesulfobacillus acetoxydans]CEJ09677.1 Spore germination protein KA [Acididesulfobacillus acetoxydans]
MTKFIKPLKLKPKLLGQKQEQDKPPVNQTENAGLSGAAWKDEVLGQDLEANLRQIKAILNKCSDVIYREFIFAQNEAIRLALIYTDGLVDKAQISEQIMRALALEVPQVVPGLELTKAQALEFIKQRGLCIHQVKESNRLQDLILAILSGDTVLLVDGHATAIINGARGFEARAISEPEAEPTVRGPREAFVESLGVNTSLIRRKIKSPNLKIETLRLGEVSGTDVAIIYVEGIVNDKLVTEVKSRLERIKIDAILESGYIEELIEDGPWSPFPTVNHTEKPDRAAAMLLEGRAVILVDGTPFVLTVPMLFFESLQASEDYYERFLFTSAIRLVRFLAMVTSLVLPGLYISLVSFNHELLPTTLLLSIAAQREAVPYPVLIEVLAMEFAFEVLREAGIRLPRPIGQAVSIVGALVVGEAAVQAGMVAPATVIVVALTGISSFVVAYSTSITFRLLRFILIILSGTLGLVGLITGVAMIGIHLCTLRSFGVPYLSPLVPTTAVDLKDTFFRAPWWAMFSRPRLAVRQGQKKQAQDLKPTPPETGP